MKRIHKQLICDEATVIRLAWLREVLLQRYRMPPMKAGVTTIIRRALEAYCVHLEHLMSLPDQHDDPTTDREFAEGLEGTRLRAAAQGSDLGVPIGAVEGKPVRPLSELVRERARTLELPIEVIRRELAGIKKEQDDDGVRQRARTLAKEWSTPASDEPRNDGTHVGIAG